MQEKAYIYTPFPIRKAWGKELIIASNDKYCGKILCVDEGAKSSLHFHVDKHETFCILKGEVEMELIHRDGSREVRVMSEGEVLEVPPGLVHSFKGLEYSEIMEVSTCDKPEDSYRITRSTGAGNAE